MNTNKEYYENIAQFEIKEEAEFYLKYGNIETVIKFPTPPTYEEFLSEKIILFLDRQWRLLCFRLS